MTDRQVAKQIHKVFQQRKVAKTQFRKIRADQVGYIQIDLMDMVRLQSPENKNLRYIVVIIDVFSRYVWYFMTATKDLSNIAMLFEKWLNQQNFKIITLTSDQEFNKAPFHNLANRYGFQQYFSEAHEKFRSGLVERMNRTLRQKIALYMTENDTFRYIDALPKIVKEYNHTKHTATNKTPYQVITGSEPPDFEDPKFVKDIPIGSWVRILRPKHERGTFAKGDIPYYTSQIYQVIGKDRYRFLLQNLNTGSRVNRPYGIHQLQVIPQSTSRKQPKTLNSRRKSKDAVDQATRRVQRSGIKPNTELIKKAVAKRLEPPTPKTQKKSPPLPTSLRRSTRNRKSKFSSFAGMA